eukprot:g580.t1
MLVYSFVLKVLGTGKRKIGECADNSTDNTESLVGAQMSRITSPNYAGRDAALDDIKHTFKLVLIGDSGVGKSNLLLRITSDTFDPEHTSTVGVEFASRYVNIMGDKVQTQIWDTAGQERFRSITQAYYRGAMGCFVVYDVTDRRTLNGARAWLGELKEHASSDIETILFGNKTDLCEDLIDVGGSGWVRREEAAKLCQEFGLIHAIGSAKSGVGVEEAFIGLIKNIYAKHCTTMTALTSPRSLNRFVLDGDPRFANTKGQISSTQTQAAASAGCCS